jgi:hypothetical protein
VQVLVGRGHLAATLMMLQAVFYVGYVVYVLGRL